MPGDFDLSWWGFRAAASFCRPISICKPVGEAEVDSLCAAMHVLPVSSFLVCPKFLGLHQEFSCQRFPSPVERRELCRYTSESAGVARLAPCPSADLRCLRDTHLESANVAVNDLPVNGIPFRC